MLNLWMTTEKSIETKRGEIKPMNQLKKSIKEWVEHVPIKPELKRTGGRKRKEKPPEEEKEKSIEKTKVDKQQDIRRFFKARNVQEEPRRQSDDIRRFFQPIRGRVCGGGREAATRHHGGNPGRPPENGDGRAEL